MLGLRYVCRLALALGWLETMLQEACHTWAGLLNSDHEAYDKWHMISSICSFPSFRVVHFAKKVECPSAYNLLFIHPPGWIVGFRPAVRLRNGVTSCMGNS